MLNGQIRAELIPVGEMETIVGAFIDATKAKILALPSSLAPRVAVSTDPAEVRELLTKAVHDALRELSQTEIVGAVKERARKGAMRADLAELVEGEVAG